MPAILIGAHLHREDIGDAARAIAVDSIFVSAVDVDPTRGAADRETMLLATAARQRMIQKEIFVAFRYGTPVNDDVVEAKCAPHVARWRDLLERWRGHVEITTKIAAQKKAERPDRTQVASGAEYMRLLNESRTIALEDEVRTKVEAAMAPIARESKWQPRPDGGAEYVVLARRESLQELKGISEKLRADLAIPFLLSGPWPLEAFADER